MSIAVDGIGLVGSVLGIWQFLTSLVPPQKQAASQYRIQVGVDGYQGLSNAGGNIDKILVYNVNGELLGGGGSGSVSKGSYIDLSVDQFLGQQALTTEFCKQRDVTMDLPKLIGSLQTPAMTLYASPLLLRQWMRARNGPGWEIEERFVVWTGTQAVIMSVLCTYLDHIADHVRQLPNNMDKSGKSR